MTSGQYHVVRFTPDPVRDEPLNIGLVMVGEFEPLFDFPDDALERASRWCAALDKGGFVALRDDLNATVERALSIQADLADALDPGFLGEQFGPLAVSEPRWVDLESPLPAETKRVFDFLLSRIVSPPKLPVYGASPHKKLAQDVIRSVKQFRPDARRGERLVGRSQREFEADVFAGGSHPLVLSTLALNSTPQAIKAVEAKAFQLIDVGASLENAHLVACCSFPAIDPKGVAKASRMILDSIDVTVVAPDEVANLASRSN